MRYTILESRVKYQNGRIKNITVLVDCTNASCTKLTDVRAIYASTSRSFGYLTLSSDAVLNDNLLQEVANGGITKFDKDKIFPDWREEATKFA